ncbi:MAG: cytochrome c [Candidatus Rokubacteria bacterium]|nr:cytochrome c [Candidatus Rokubacteria bacterium]
MGAVRAFRARFATARVFAPLALGSLFAGLVGLADAASPPPSPVEGQAIFQEKCVSCHTIGGGRLVGPDLQGVTARRDREWQRLPPSLPMSEPAWG